MRVALVTGIQGFAGKHLAEHLIKEGVEVHGLTRREFDLPAGMDQGRLITMDLTDPLALEKIFQIPGLNEIYHLAALSFVPASWKDPSKTLQINTEMPARLVDQARKIGWKGRILFVSTSEVYDSLLGKNRPITEEFPLNPGTPYSVSKLAAESMLRVLATDDVQVLIARPFNHIGQGQSESFVVPSFFNKILKAKSEGADHVMAGDLKSGRDFSDVRDVVHAYSLLMRKGINREIYNVCSGSPTMIGELMDEIQSICESNLEIRVDPALLRPEGSSLRFGSSDKLRELGWTPRYTLRETLESIHGELIQKKEKVG